MSEIFIDVDFDKHINEIRKMLGSLDYKAPSVLQNALNSTTLKIRKMIIKDAKGEYKLSDTSILKTGNAADVYRARKPNYKAVIKSEGSMNDLMKFMVSPTDIAKGTLAPESYSAKVFKSSGMKALDGKVKPFVTKFKSGHIAIAVRVPGRPMKSDPKKDFIKKLLSPAVPHMLQNEEVRAKAEKEIERLLPLEIEKRINKILENERMKGGAVQ